MNPKAGIKLLKTKEEWQISNDYLFNLHGDIYNVQEEIIYFQKTLYDYFKVQYGTIKSVDRNTEYQEMQSNLSKRQLRKTLTTLYIHRFLYLYIH